MRETTKTLPVNLRMPVDLKEWLTERAQVNFRSLSSEIVMHLHELREREGQQHEGQPT